MNIKQSSAIENILETILESTKREDHEFLQPNEGVAQDGKNRELDGSRTVNEWWCGCAYGV